MNEFNKKKCFSLKGCLQASSFLFEISKRTIWAVGLLILGRGLKREETRSVVEDEDGFIV